MLIAFHLQQVTIGERCNAFQLFDFFCFIEIPSPMKIENHERMRLASTLLRRRTARD